MTPFFSIGITTYDRMQFLKKTILSILKQNFTNYEVIISNDNPEREITSKLLGFNDPRIKFINQKRNLGEYPNMNLLLKISKGKYFTWLADDDLYQKNFLAQVYQAVTSYQNISCVFTSYTNEAKLINKQKNNRKNPVILNGRQFLKSYLMKKIRVLGCYGVFKSSYLKKNRGIKKLGTGFGPYSDSLLAIKAGLLDKVVYLDKPLIFYRSHKNSISFTSMDLTAYLSAQQELCYKSVKIFKNKNLAVDFKTNLLSLLRWCIKDFVVVLYRAGFSKLPVLIDYLKFLKRYTAYFKRKILIWQTYIFLAKMLVVYRHRLIKKD